MLCLLSISCLASILSLRKELIRKSTNSKCAKLFTHCSQEGGNGFFLLGYSLVSIYVRQQILGRTSKKLKRLLICFLWVLTKSFDVLLFCNIQYHLNLLMAWYGKIIVYPCNSCAGVQFTWHISGPFLHSSGRSYH